MEIIRKIGFDFFFLSFSSGTLPPELDVEYVIALGCGLVTFVLLSVCVVAMIKLKGGGKCKKKKKKTEKKKTIKEEEFKQRKSNSSSVDSIEKDPDIIPSHNEGNARLRDYFNLAPF